MQPLLGDAGVRRMVETMLAGSAASCGPVKTMHFAALEVADVSLRWAQFGGGAPMDGMGWSASSGQEMALERQARRRLKMKAGVDPRGKTIGSEVWARSLSRRRSAKVQLVPEGKSKRASSREWARAIVSHCS